ncbi:FAD-dependent oxidoreductase [Pseudomonas citronellolis]|uniref:FAD-dependent oxidoreductase n=1 Tax=Pseudomonas citronellolis TaxID=53408 RepID=UPI000778CEED|nr:FAD-dependent oxidoreductase [Pseudomonas citronellolis]AMO75994.1 Fumarate reductase flavoprotein subunit precursor [Pseudomonas citronellolis]
MTDLNFDLVVVGCGVAGLSAALSGAENGLRVAVLERATREERGGQSRFTEAYLRMKSHEEVTDDFDTFLAEHSGYYQDPDFVAESLRDRASRSIQARAVGTVDANVIGAFSAYVPETIDWLKANGVKFDFLPTQFLTSTQPRLLPVGGGEAVVEALAARAEALGAQFFYETTGRSLITEGGKVIGLRARSREWGELQFLGAVVLASGGFEGNPEMLARYLGPRSVFLRPVCKGGYYNRGEGIQMALDVGAAPCGEYGSYHAEPVDPRSGVSEPSIFIFPYGVLVNQLGERFTDEAPGTVDAWYERVTRQIYQQPEGMAWVILDQRVKDIPNYRLGIRTDQPAVEAPTLAGLAEKIGVPAATLEEQVARYNAACRPGDYRPLQLDGVATEGLLPAKSNWALPLDRGPYMAYPIISANVFTFGGLKIDEEARVIDADGEPIDNLYAAGETVGLYFGNYAGGTSVLKGLVFGRLAGQAAAARRSV